MKKNNKRLFLSSQTIRSLTEQQLGNVAGGLPQSQGPTNCLSCTSCLPACDPTYSQFPCITHNGGGTCATTCH